MRYKNLLLVVISLFPSLLWGQNNIHTRLNSWLNQYRMTFSDKSPEYADALQVCAKVCMENEDVKQAYSLINISNKIFKLYGTGVFEGRDTIQEIFHMDLLSQMEYKCDRDYHAVRYARKAYKLKRSYFGLDSSVTLMSALNLSKLLAERHKYGESHNIHNNAFATYVNILKKEFCNISESERATYWKTAYKYIGHTIQIANSHPKRSNKGGDKSLAAAAYNALLLSKGILLNTSIGFEEFVTKSGNANAINKLNKKKELQGLSCAQSVLDSLDYEILRDLKLTGNTYNIPQLDVTWKDVQRSLKKGDIAIEFYRTEEFNYGAVVVKQGWQSPKVVKLGNEIQISKHQYAKLDKVLKEKLIQTIETDGLEKFWNLSKAVWPDELLQFIPTKGKGRIFFSADANLQIAGIESFLLSPHLTSKGEIVTMSECFDIYRLSSTRELCYRHTNSNHTNAVLYGGLEYDLTDEELIAEHTNFQKSSYTAEIAQLIVENHSGKKRGADNIDILPGTQFEVEAIDKILKQSLLMQSTIQTGKHGTEETFKYFSGKSPEIIRPVRLTF